ncbi:MAG: hypothetical protein AAF934_11910 [Bacteroidota bacterium]
MQVLRRKKTLRKLYRSGYVDRKISEEVIAVRIAVLRIKESMLSEEAISARRIQQLRLTNAYLKEEIASRNNGKQIL